MPDRRLDELAAKAYPNEIVQNEVKSPTFIRGLKDNRIKLQLVQGETILSTTPTSIET